ncbi:hypothetical protein JCM6882_003314 [Rhodosporidiobolus microsporus]
MVRQFELDGPHPPPLEMFAFLIPLTLQCLLLHPTFPSPLSRFLRFALLPLSLTLSFSAPYRFAIEPRNQAVGVNFVFGIMGGYGVWKALEWGLASDLTPYTWVGFEENEEEGQTGGGNGPTNGHAANGAANGHDSTPAKPSKAEVVRRKKREHAHLLALRAHQAASSTPLSILRDTLHLLLAMRGQGYSFCQTSTEPFPLPPRAFFRRLSLEIAWSHPLLVFCAALLLEPPTIRDALVYSFLPVPEAWRTPTVAHNVGEGVTGLAMGIAVFAALTLGYSVATMLVFLPTVVVRALPIPAGVKPPPFDPREYPPLFNFARRPQSVAVFWSKQWHSFFARPFRFLAFDPAHKLITPLFGKLVSRSVGVLAVFALSSWIHEYGLSTGTSTLHLSPSPPDPSSLPLPIRWGGSLYFMLQGVAIILEGAFTALTGRKTGGWGGTVWNAVVSVGVGGVLYKSWMTQGLVREVPPVASWSWPRFVVPLGCLQPPPMWMSSLPESYGFERHV